MVCDVGRLLSFSAVKVIVVTNSVLRSVFGFDVVFLWCNSRNFGGCFDRAVGRCEFWSRVVDRAQAQQAVHVVQATSGLIDFPLGALDVIVSILDTPAKLRGLLARERD